MDLSMLGKGKMDKGDKRGGGKNGKSKGGDGKDDKKGKGKKGKDNANATEYFAGYCLGCEAWGHMKKACWWNEPQNSGKETGISRKREHSRQSTGRHDH